MLATLQQDLRSINSPAQRRAFLDSLADSDLDEPDDSDVDMFTAILEAFAPPPSASRKGKDKKAQRRGK